MRKMIAVFVLALSMSFGCGKGSESKHKSNDTASSGDCGRACSVRGDSSLCYVFCYVGIFVGELVAVSGR